MTKEEEQYKKDLEANGVDIPEVKGEEEKPEEKSKDEEPEKQEEEEESKPSDEPDKKPHKRSIYQEYKEKKEVLRDTKQALEAERLAKEEAIARANELQAKIEAFQNADTAKERQEAKDELDALAEEIQADPVALRKMRDVFLKNVKPESVIDENTRKSLEEFNRWKEQNSEAMEKQKFEAEFNSAKTTLNEFFPKVSSDEIESIKAKVDELAHSKEWHDKTIDYIIFKNKATLSALVSPKKRGMESKGKTDVEDTNFDFDPNADYSKMTPAEREAWEKGYNSMTKTNGLATDSQGRKIII